MPGAMPSLLRAAFAGVSVLACGGAALALGGCGGTSSADSPASAGRPPVEVPPPPTRVLIDDPSPDARIRARPVGRRLHAAVLVHGSADAGQKVRVSGACRRSRCTRLVVADQDGTWETRLRLRVPATARTWRITARYAVGASPATGDQVTVRLRRPRRATARKADRGLPAASQTTRPATPESPAPSGGFGGNVLVVGDSLEVLSAPYLQRYLPGVDLTINVKGGYSSIQIFKLFRESFERRHAVVVFDAGTNDNPSYPQILESNLKAVADAVGNRCLVVPTIHGLTVNGVNSRYKNRVVRAFAASRPGTQTPEWAATVRAHPELMQSDDLHPTAAGADYRARLIAAGVQTCLAFG